MTLKEELDGLYRMTVEMEKKQIGGESITDAEVSSLKSLTLTLECIAESMVPERREKSSKGK